MQQIGVELHGVTLNVSCNCEPLVEYLVHLLGADVRPVWAAPDLAVSGIWRSSPVAAAQAFPEASANDGFGKRMRLAGDELVWFDTHRDKDLQLRFRRRATQVLFDVDYWYHPTPEKLARYPDYEQRKFFKLLRYLV